MEPQSHKRPDGWQWDNKLGIGFLPVNGKPVPYDQAYFDKYVGYAHTQRGKQITNTRANQVIEHGVIFPGRPLVLDVGIGSGDFVLEMRKRGVSCYGLDVNPVGIEWLNKRFWNIEQTGCSHVDVMTLWDVMEHIENPIKLFQKYNPRQIHICMPVYTTEESVFSSKHYRPNEHLWYFTRQGLVAYMHGAGYSCIGIHEYEVALGREDISTFVFQKKLQ